MKTRAIKIWTRMISFCLVLLGFSACGSDGSDDDLTVMVEYGVPTAAYKISGKVVSTENPDKGIEGIEVVMEASGRPVNQGIDSVKTSPKGEFLIQTFSFPLDKYNIKIKDIDGEANGWYENKDVEIEFSKNDYKNGSGSWNKGTAEKNMGTIKLTPKEEKKKE